MTRGTTPTLVFKCPFEVDDATAMNVIFVQYPSGYAKTILEKELDDVTISGKNITVSLTQLETLSFTANIPVSIQIRLILDGVAMACNTITADVNAILKDGVLS